MDHPTTAGRIGSGGEEPDARPAAEERGRVAVDVVLPDREVDPPAVPRTPAGEPEDVPPVDRRPGGDGHAVEVREAHPDVAGGDGDAPHPGHLPGEGDGPREGGPDGPLLPDADVDAPVARVPADGSETGGDASPGRREEAGEGEEHGDGNEGDGDQGDLRGDGPTVRAPRDGRKGVVSAVAPAPRPTGGPPLAWPQDPTSEESVSMTIRIGLMGFGRIGRNVFRMLDRRTDLEVVAIADIADPEGLTYLLRYDSIYGRYPRRVEFADGALFDAGRRIPFLSAMEPGDAPWKDLGVDIVVQATRRYRTREWCERHLEAGASGVILASTPETPGDVPVLIRGVNDHILTEQPPVVALGSNTSNALTPVLEVLDAAFGIEAAFFTTVHALTNSQRLADVPSEGFRQSRAAGENIIPSETNSAEIIGQVLPHLTGRLAGTALNVPVVDGSTVDLVATLRVPASVAGVNAAVRSACGDGYRDIIEYSEDPIVSSDVRMSPHSGVFDSLATMVMDGTMAKTVTWFNNGWGYSARIIEVAERMAAARSVS